VFTADPVTGSFDFVRCVDFTRIAASNTASDDVTN